MKNIEKWTDWEAPTSVLPNSSTQNLEVKDQLLINETKWLNDGVPYFDEGMEGVPDTTFSPTGALLYPDGVIEIRTSKGKCRRFPDGRQTCMFMGDTILNPTVARGSVYSTTVDGQVFPMPFSTKPKITFISERTSGSNTWINETSSSTATESGFGQLWSYDTAGYATAGYIAIGEWK